MKISSKLNELKPLDLNCNVFDVYTYDGLSMQELLCQFFTKINECIKVSNETIDLATWLVNEGLKIEVVNKLMLWLEDGTLENLINVNLFNTLHDKIEYINTQLTHKVDKEKIYYVNLKDYKDYTTTYVCEDGTTKTDWGVAINQALSDCIGELIIPYGTYYSSLPIETVNPVKITGMGINASFIKLMPGVELPTNYFFKINRHYTTLQHLNIQGSLTEYDIKTINGLDLSGSNHLTIENVKVQNFTGNGINIYQPSYDTHLNHVLSWGNKGNGYVLEATDLFLSKCIACEVGEHGFVIKKGNNQLNQCKAYFTGHTGKTGTGDGFYIRTDEAGNVASHTTRLLSCEAQETGRHGFYLYNSNSIQLIACQADSGSVHTKNSYGYFMKNLKQSNISGVVTNKEFLKGHFKYGSLISGCSGTSIDIKTECVDYYDKYGVEPSKYFVKEVDIDGFNMSNNIMINNNNIQPNLFKNECLILDEDGDGLSDYMVDGGSTGGIEYGLTINRYNQAQELKVTNTNNSNIDKNCKIYTEGSIKNGSNFAFSVTTKTSNSKLVPFVRINFYGSSDVLLGQFADYLNSSKYKLLCLNNQSWYTFNLDVAIPDNAIKFKIELGSILKEVGASGSVYYKNLKYNYR